MSNATTMDKYFKDKEIPDHLNKADIQTIRDWLTKQPHLPEISDRQIAIFLHSCFGTLELTKNTIDVYYTVRTHAPELFQNRNPKEVAETLNVVWCAILEKKCPDGCRIVMVGLKDTNADKFNLIGYLRALLCLLDIIAVDNSFDEGLRLVYDMNGASFGHLAKFSVYCSVLPGLSLDKHHLFVAGLKDHDAEKFSVPEAIKLFFSLLDLEGHFAPYASGWRVIFNAKGLSFGHFTKLTAAMGIIRKVICYLQDGLPLRLKGIHVFNAIPLVNQFLALIRPIMKKELYELIHVHATNDAESLYEFVPKEYLPSNFGGQAPSIDDLIKESRTKVETYKQWFVDDDKFGRVDEMKRVGKAKNSGDIFGIEGSFKKLDFD